MTALLVAIATPLAAAADSGPKLCYRLFTKLRYWSRFIEPQAARISSEERLAYFDTGPRRAHEPPRRPILLLHGFTADKESWLGMVRRLRKSHRVVAPDLAGHGDSLGPASERHGLADQAERAHQLAEKLGLGEVHVLGHSMGGGVAVALALKYPAQVRSLGLIAPAIKEQPHTREFLGYLDGRGEGKAGKPINPLLVGKNWTDTERVHYVSSGPRWLHWLARHFPSCLGRPTAAHRELHPNIFDELSLPRPESGRSDTRPEADGRPEILLWDTGGGVLRGRLGQPTLVLWGTEDRVLQPDPDYLKQRAEIAPIAKELPGVGHSPIIEAARRTAELYLEFLAGLEGQPASQAHTRAAGSSRRRGSRRPR